MWQSNGMSFLRLGYKRHCSFASQIATLGSASCHALKQSHEDPHVTIIWGLVSELGRKCFSPDRSQTIVALVNVLTATSWKTMNQNLQWRCFSDPQKLCNTKCLLFGAAKFWANLWHSNRWLIYLITWGKVYVHYYVKEQVIKKTSLISCFLYSTHLYVILIMVFLF